MWTHIRGERDVFVTNDENFHSLTKRPQLLALGARQVLRAIDALHLVTTMVRVDTSKVDSLGQLGHTTDRLKGD